MLGRCLYYDYRLLHIRECSKCLSNGPIKNTTDGFVLIIFNATFVNLSRILFSPHHQRAYNNIRQCLHATGDVWRAVVFFFPPPSRGFTSANVIFEKYMHTRRVGGGRACIYIIGRCWPVIRASGSFQSRHYCI